jgi:hypothetical protein
MTKMLADAATKYPMTVDYKKLVLGQAELVANSNTTPTTAG